jgi:hypothetical protein
MSGTKKKAIGLTTIATLLAVLMVIPLAHTATVGGSLGATIASPGGPNGGVVFPTPIHHVIVILLENNERSTVMNGSSFEENLADRYATATHYYAVCHPSEPNYLALAGASTLGRCGTDAYANLSGANLPDSLEALGLTWGAFAQSMPHPCDVNDSYPYAVRHNPFVFYNDIVQNTSRCDRHVVNFTAWHNDEVSGKIPNYSFIIPNVINDGHDTTSSYADAWLRGFMAPITSASWFNSTAVFIVYDEGLTNAGYTVGHLHLYGGNVYATVVSPYTLGEGSYSANVSHYNLVTTVEWLLGLGEMTNNDDPVTFPPMFGMFEFAPADDHDGADPHH